MKKVNPDFYQYRKLRRKEKRTLVKISVLFVLNLVLSNSSVQYNSLALDQVNYLFLNIFLIGGYLLYNIVLSSTVQQNGLAIRKSVLCF